MQNNDEESQNVDTENLAYDTEISIRQEFMLFPIQKKEALIVVQKFTYL